MINTLSMASKKVKIKKNKYKSLLRRLLGLGILLILISIIYGAEKFQATPETAIQGPMVTPTPGGPLEYNKHGFNLTDSQHKQTPYPDVMRTISDQDLYAFSCSDRFNWGQLLSDEELNSTFAVPVSTGKRIYPFNQQEEAALIKAAAREGNFDPKIIYGDVICYEDNGDVTLILSTVVQPKTSYFNLIPKVYAGGGGGWNAYIFHLPRTSSVPHRIAFIPVQNAPYWGCGKLYAITTYGIAYMECGGGDGGVSSTDLYQVNLSSISAERILHCQSGFNAQQESVWSCN